MIRPNLIIVVLTVFFNGCKSPHQDQQVSNSNPPNIIWLMAEDIAPDLECYGMAAVKTPNLNKLADEGILYTRAFGTNSICSPNRSAMMVGVHQNITGTQHHRSNRNMPLADPYKPITYYLREAGYTCILGHEKVMRNGRKIDVNFKHEPLGPWDGQENFGLFDKLDTIDAADQPFFAQIQLVVTHRGDWWEEISRQSNHRVNPDSVELPPYMADHPVVREDWARYLDQIEYMDDEVGMLMQELEEKGLAENTVVIFIGDNGRCNIRGKGYLFDPGLHIPLIVRWPAGLEPGQVSKQMISVTDISASILQLAGVALPEYIDSQPFIGASSNRQEVYSARDLWDEVMENSRSITTDRFKYVANYRPEQSFDARQAYLEFYRPAVHIMRELNSKNQLNAVQEVFFKPDKPREELYDLVNDPHETKNLAGDPAYIGQLEELRSKLETWEANLPDDQRFKFVDPEAVKILEWVKYTKPELYQEMLNGKEIGFQRLAQEFRKLAQ